MKMFLLWFALNGAVAFASVMAVRGNAGCGNLVVFMLWFFVVMAGLSAGVPEVKAKVRARGRGCPAWLSVAYDFSMVGLFAYHGWFLTALGCLLLFVFEGMIHDSPPEEKGAP